jgi:hypothetical protein
LVSFDPPEYKVSFDHSCSEQQLSVYQPPIDSTQGKPPPFKNRMKGRDVASFATITAVQMEVECVDILSDDD